MSLISRFINMSYDLKYGINTRGVVSSSVIDGFHYATLEYRDIRNILSKMNLTTHDYFLDIGCGKGRVLAVCSKYYNPKEVIGVEYDELLYKNGLNNIEKFNRIHNREIKIAYADALNYDYKNISAIYMFNPFGKETLNKCIEKIVETNKSSSLTISYVNPRYKEVFTENYSDYFEILQEYTVGKHIVILYNKTHHR